MPIIIEKTNPKSLGSHAGKSHQLPNKTNPNKKTDSKWNYFKDLSSIVCSRESTYRTALDITAFDIPVLFADAFRGIKKFLESGVECLSSTVLVYIAPQITTLVGKVLGKIILPKEMQKDAVNYLQFSMDELRDPEKFKDAKHRIKEQESEDKKFVSSLFKRVGREKSANYYKDKAEEIKSFFTNLEPTEEKRKLAYKLKKATMIFESAIEGGWWGGYGLVLRWFRKHILKEDRFTGTKGYVNDDESKKLGESGELNLFQKILGGGAIFISPVLTWIGLNKVEDREAVKKSPFLQMVDKQFDTTHGVFPRLGLLFAQTTVPKWIGTITTSQGWFERGERILKLLTVIPSWWFGHRLTNGLLALNADKKLAEKYKTDRGILVEKEYLKPADKNDSWFTKLDKRFPDPAQIHHVIKSTEHNKELQKEAEDQHAKCLYTGFALHSALVWVINMGVNHLTKLRALYALGK